MQAGESEAQGIICLLGLLNTLLLLLQQEFHTKGCLDILDVLRYFNEASSMWDALIVTFYYKKEGLRILFFSNFGWSYYKKMMQLSYIGDTDYSGRTRGLQKCFC